MKPLLIFTATLLSCFLLNAQTDSLPLQTKKPKEYMVSVSTTTGKVEKGILYYLDDNQLMLVKNKGKKNKILFTKNPDPSIVGRTFSAEQIQSLTLKRKNSIRNGVLIGAGTGVLIGVIAGFASGNDPVYQNPQYNSSQDPYGIGYALGSFAVGINNAFAMTAGQKALVGGLGLGVSGALVGAVIGAIAHKKFIINGKKEKFDMMRESVLDKTYGKPANK